MFNKKLHDPIETVAKPTISYITVTPDMAERWLKTNTVNRSVREAKVRQYASDMIAGRWTHSADMICFSPDGLLLNGQHRLHAVVRSGCTITFAIQRNTPHEAMQNMDTGAARKISDVLGWRSEKNSVLLGAASKLAIIYTDGRIYKDNKTQAVSHGEIVDFIDMNPLIRDSVTVGLSTYPHIDCSGSVLAAAHFIISEASGAEDATHFFHRLSTRAGEEDGSVVLALDKRLREIRRMRQSFTPREFLALLIKAWNFDVKGTPVQKLNITQRGEFRIPDPMPRKRFVKPLTV